MKTNLAQQVQHAGRGVDAPFQTVLDNRTLLLLDYSLFAYCFSAAISIALAQIFLGIAIACWLFDGFYRKRRDRTEQKLRSANSRNPIVLPALVFVFAVLYSSVAGVDPLHAIPEAIKSTVWLLVPFAVAHGLSAQAAQKNSTALLHKFLLYSGAIISGQALAAFHTALFKGGGYAWTPGFPGAVTESGQLVFSIPLGIAILWHLRQRDSALRILYSNAKSVAVIALCVGSLMAYAFPQGLVDIVPLGLSSVRLIGLATFAGLLVFSLLMARQRKAFEHCPAAKSYLLLLVAVGLLIAALFVNLKRGPWAAVLVELCLLGSLLSKRLLLVTIGGFASLFLILEPLQYRLAEYSEHFVIQGGRQQMWSLGGEIIQRFPLGVGADNARYMQTLDASLPEIHRHMHNNFLNVLVEYGWIGLTAYLGTLGALFFMGWFVWKRGALLPIEDCRLLRLWTAAIGTALFGWQCAGMVEYNFGDGEVKLLALFCIGLMLSLWNHCLQWQRQFL